MTVFLNHLPSLLSRFMLIIKWWERNEMGLDRFMQPFLCHKALVTGFQMMGQKGQKNKKSSFFPRFIDFLRFLSYNFSGPKQKVECFSRVCFPTLRFFCTFVDFNRNEEVS